MVQILGCLGTDKRASAVKRRPSREQESCGSQEHKVPRSQVSLLQSWVGVNGLADPIWTIPSHGTAPSCC